MTKINFSMLRADETERIAEMSRMATEILREHYDPIVGKLQNDYMLDKFQSVKAIGEQLGNGYRYYFVRCDGRNVGFMAFYPRQKAMYLSKLYLYKDERGKGFSRQMIAFVAEEARRENLCAVELNVNKHNPSISVYESLGFRHLRAEKIDIGHGYFMDDFVMRLEI